MRALVRDCMELTVYIEDGKSILLDAHLLALPRQHFGHLGYAHPGQVPFDAAGGARVARGWGSEGFRYWVDGTGNSFGTGRPSVRTAARDGIQVANHEGPAQHLMFHDEHQGLDGFTPAAGENAQTA